MSVKSKPGELKLAVKTAIESGYRLIDCAYIYGNEGEVGDALTQVMRDETVRREDVFIISKVTDRDHSVTDCNNNSILSSHRVVFDLSLFLVLPSRIQ